MASPAGPLTPPAEPPSTLPTNTQPTSAPSQPTQQPTTTTAITALLSQPLTSLTDDGSARRPRDARLIHLLLQSYGISAYQERVPLQLMDFAYRYTAGILNDAVHIRDEGYDQPPSATGKRKKDLTAAQALEDGDLSLNCLRIAIASRQVAETGGRGAVNKEFLKGLTEERNRIGLNVGAQSAGPSMGSVRLPAEKYCLTGVGWGLREEWESEGEEEVPVQGDGEEGEDVSMGMDGAGNEEVEGLEEEEGEGNMEDIFGADDGDGAGGGEDQEMQDL